MPWLGEDEKGGEKYFKITRGVYVENTDQARAANLKTGLEDREGRRDEERYSSLLEYSRKI